MMEYFPKSPSDFMLFYGAILFFAMVLLFRKRPKNEMRLRLRGRGTPRAEAPPEPKAVEGAMPPDTPRGPPQFSRIQASGERPLNVVFNYNGHSWDAYEVLGLPAGSSPDKVHDAFAESMKTIDPGSKPFLEAAYRAIRAEWDSFAKSRAG